MSKATTIQIYITNGALGKHAGAYSNNRCWAAHPTDAETAAWRCAVKFWFGKGTNAAWSYRNIKRVVIWRNSDNTWQATLADAAKPEKKSKVPQFELPTVAGEVRRKVRRKPGGTL